MTFLLNLVFGLGKLVRAGLAALFGWLFADWRHPPLLLFAIGFAAHVFVITPKLREDRDAARAAHAAEVEAHNGTIAEFVMATREAERRQAANLTRVASEQAAITGRIEHDYQTKLDALRARHAALAADAAGRLRSAAGAAEVDPGAPRSPGLPGAGAAASLTGEAPGSDGFSLERRLIASEQALQLDALIDWVLAQASVTNSPEGRKDELP